GPMYTWKPDGTGSTLLTTGGFNNGDVEGRVGVSPNGRILFSDRFGPNMYTWKEGNIASVIMTGQDDYYGLAFTSNNRAFFGADNISSGKYLTWVDDGTATGSLSTLIPSGSYDSFETLVLSDDRVVIGANSSSGYDKCYTWKESTGVLSTISGG